MTDQAVVRLSDKQLAAIERILLGENITDVARGVDVSRETIYRWQLRPEFRDELAARRALVHEQVFDRLRDLVPKALTLMERAIASEMEKEKPDWRVAAKVLDLIEKSRPAMPSIDVTVGVETEMRDLDGPPTTRLRTMEELRQRNVKAWETTGKLVGPSIALGAKSERNGA